MTKTKQILAAFALVAASSTLAVAQGSSDIGSGLGGGAGAVGSVTSYGRGLTLSQRARSLVNVPQRSMSAFVALRQQLTMTATGLRVVNPAGGTSQVTPSVLASVGNIIGGSATPAQVDAFTASLTGVPSGQATALTAALQAFGANSNYGNLATATRAFNAAIDALPAGASVPPALLAVRVALAAAAVGPTNSIIASQ